MTTKKEDAFLKHKKLTFNQALLIMNGEMPTFDKYSDESFASVFKPRKGVSEHIYKLRSEGNVELSEIEGKEYSEKIKAYNLLVSIYDDDRPTTPTINTQEFLIWAVSNKLLKEIKSTNQHKPSQNEKPAKKPRQSTIDRQNYINEIAKELMDKYPELAKQHLSTDVSKLLIERHKIKLKPTAILRDYLEKYPNF